MERSSGVKSDKAGCGTVGTSSAGSVPETADVTVVRCGDKVGMSGSAGVKESKCSGCDTNCEYRASTGKFVTLTDCSVDAGGSTGGMVCTDGVGDDGV